MRRLLVSVGFCLFAQAAAAHCVDVAPHAGKAAPATAKAAAVATANPPATELMQVALRGPAAQLEENGEGSSKSSSDGSASKSDQASSSWHAAPETLVLLAAVLMLGIALRRSGADER